MTSKKGPTLKKKKVIPKLNQDQGEKNRLIQYGLYIKAIEGVKHFDTVQTSYRIFTSTLLLAIFAVIGFLFSSTSLNLSENYRLVMASVVGFLGLVPITVVCFLDLVFQERLLMSNFITAEKIELKNKWIPSVHSKMFSNGTHHGEPLRKVWFYIGCGWSLIWIIMLCLAALVSEFPNEKLDITLTFLLGLLASWGYYKFLSKVTGRYSDMIKVKKR